jgi:hypothetical protein
VSRPCGWCRHPQRVALEERVLRGESIQSVTIDAKLPYWPSAGHRHFRAHVRPELRRAVPTAHLADFAQRLLDMADDAAAQRERARTRGDAKTLLAAMREERAAVSDLVSALGITADEVVDQLQDMRALALAVREVVLDSAPELGERLAAQLEGQGQDDLAESLLSLLDRRPQLHAVRTKELNP